MGTRPFSVQIGNSPPGGRTVDNDAPQGLRLEFLDSVFALVDGDHQGRTTDQQFYHVLRQSMGLAAAPDNPMNGPRRGAARQLRDLPWSRFYDLVCRWWREFPPEMRGEYVRQVNVLLAAYRIVWELRADGALHTVLPAPVQTRVDAVFEELRSPQFEAAQASLRAALDAYNDRPRRASDSCRNAMDALESVAKTVTNMPTRTFGDVLAELRRQQRLAQETITVLQKLYDMANNHFRHGMVDTFRLLPCEVDFVVLTCMAGILLLARR